MTALLIRLLRTLVYLAAPADERHELLGDLEDARRRRAAHGPDVAADRWYRRQLARSIAPMLIRRITRARPRTAGIGLGHDVRVAWRSLASAPMFSGSVVVMLALAVGSHTVIAAVADALYLRPLPFGERSDRLVTLHSLHPTLAEDWDDAELSYLDLLDIRQEAASLERLEGVITRDVSISTGSDTQRVLAASITPGLFSMLGAVPAMGRDFTASDGAPPGFEASLILGHALWHTLTGGDRTIVGRALLLNGRQVPVVGVMPASFAFPDGQQLWLPYRAEDTIRRDQRSLLAIGLLRPGTSLASGQAELNAIAGRLAADHPGTNRDWSIRAMPMREFFVAGRVVHQLMAAVSLLLIAACANVAGLIVARGIGRQRELTLRAALGSGRVRLVRLLLIEHAMLAIAGGVAGLVAAAWGIKAAQQWIPEPPPYWAMPALDGRMVVFALLLTVGAILLTGLLPALRIARVDAAGALLPGARAAGPRSPHRRMQHALIVGQLAVSLALLVGGVLLGRSATALVDADGGFDRAALLSLRVYLAGDRYDRIDVRADAVNGLANRVAALPGVRAAAATGSIPTDDGGAAIRLRAGGTAAEGFAEIGAQLIPVTADFWLTLDLPLIDGRTFNATEAADPRAAAVVVNRRLAARLWPGASAVDRVLRVAGDRGETVELRVIGVAPDLVYEEFGEETPQSQLNVYVPYVRAGWRTQAILVRTAGGDPARLADAVRAAIREADPGLAVFDVLTMDDRRAYNHWADRFAARAFSAFAIGALLLACVGVYAIAAGTVAQRRREIGLRIALGAARGDIRNLFLGHGVRLALSGTIAGIPLAIVLARLLGPGLFRVSAWDRDVWTVLPLALVTAAVLATYLPARSATRIDPATTLRDG